MCVRFSHLHGFVDVSTEIEWLNFKYLERSSQTPVNSENAESTHHGDPIPVFYEFITVLIWGDLVEQLLLVQSFPGAPHPLLGKFYNLVWGTQSPITQLGHLAWCLLCLLTT